MPDHGDTNVAAPGGVYVRPALPEDAPAVAAVIRRAFETQCRIYDDWSLPPMREDAASVLEAMRVGIVLVAEQTGRIVGTVRGRNTETGVEIGRLAVEPDHRGCGIGRMLTEALEARYPEAGRFELFTGHLSITALSLYESLGYTRVKTTRVHDGLSLVYLEKVVTPPLRDAR